MSTLFHNFDQTLHTIQKGAQVSQLSPTFVNLRRRPLTGGGIAHSGTSRRISASARPRVGLALVFVLVGLLTFLVSPALAVQHLPLQTFGSSAQPIFGQVKAIAVDQSTGDVLVADGATNSILRFHGDGTPADFSSLGSNVIDGLGPGDETPGGAGLTFSANSPAETQIAVDSSNGPARGDIYVTQAGRDLVYVFSASGEFLGQLNEADLFNSSEELEDFSFGEICGVAVGSNGAVYVGDLSGAVYKFAPSFNPVEAFDATGRFTEVASPCNLAAGRGSSAGKIFAAQLGSGSVTALNSATGAKEFQLAASSNGAIGVDPSGGHVYVATGDEVAEYRGGEEAPPISSISAVSPVESLAVDGGSRAVYVARSGSSTIELSPAGSLLPTIFDQSASGVTDSEATVQATINPEGTASTYVVEYGPTAGYGSKSAVAVLPADAEDHRVSVVLTGLSARTTYHYRFSVANSVGSSQGSDQTFPTFATPSASDHCANAALRQGSAARLPDCRAYEMVTPVDKNNTDITGLIDVNSQLAQLDQSAVSGDALTYTTSQGFGDTQGVPYVSQYIANRTPGGWDTHSITPPQGESKQNVAKRIDLEYELFSSDLCQSLLQHYTDPALAAGAVPGVPNLYRHTNCGAESYEALTTTAMPFSTGHAVAQGLSEDGNCSLFARAGGGLYETCAGHTQLVSVSVSGAPTTGYAGTASPEAQGLSELLLRDSNLQGAISANGSDIYWTEGEAGVKPVLLRENAQAAQSALGPQDECLEPAKACTVPVSNGEPALYYGASPDGARAVYMSGSDLYEFDAATGTSTLIAKGTTGVMGVSRDAARVYFSSTEAIGGHGVVGEPNLFFYDATRGPGDRYRLLGTLTSEDAQPISTERYGLANKEPGLRIARLSPDGLHAAFAAFAPLTGYDNKDVSSGQEDLEVFTYDATADGGAGALHCVSCNPTGQRPQGRDLQVESFGLDWTAGLVPSYTTSFYGSRVISDDGDRVFFDSYEALLPSDTNGKEDVYEWEAPGSGECSEASASYSSPNEGCLSLISSGESGSDSEFVDASPDGHDVFFATQESLDPRDPGLIDIYDAREGGGFPPPPGKVAACEGEACQRAASPPIDLTPASASFGGPGNVSSLGPVSVKPNTSTTHKKPSKKASKKKRPHKQKGHKKQKVRKGRASHDRRVGR